MGRLTACVPVLYPHLLCLGHPPGVPACRDKTDIGGLDNQFQPIPNSISGFTALTRVYVPEAPWPLRQCAVLTAALPLKPACPWLPPSHGIPLLPLPPLGVSVFLPVCKLTKCEGLSLCMKSKGLNPTVSLLPGTLHLLSLWPIESQSYFSLFPLLGPAQARASRTSLRVYGGGFGGQAAMGPRGCTEGIPPVLRPLPCRPSCLVQGSVWF